MRRRIRAVLLALGFVVGLAVGLVTCARCSRVTDGPLSVVAQFRADVAAWRASR